MSKNMSSTVMICESDLASCLQSLDRAKKEQVQMTLANDEVSSDEEIIELWTMECGISVEAAEAAIVLRPKMLLDPMADLFSLFS
jgi:hypothetical protein